MLYAFNLLGPRDRVKQTVVSGHYRAVVHIVIEIVTTGMKLAQG